MKTIMKTDSKLWRLSEGWERVGGSFAPCPVVSRLIKINKIFLNGVLLSVSEHILMGKKRT